MPEVGTQWKKWSNFFEQTQPTFQEPHMGQY